MADFQLGAILAIITHTHTHTHTPKTGIWCAVFSKCSTMIEESPYLVSNTLAVSALNL